MHPKNSPDEERLNPGHLKTRNLLRRVGPAVLGVGLLLMAIGMIDFFMCMGSFSRQPKYFWCIFLGMPAVFFGAVMSNIGYMGAVARYMSAESAPVAKDTFNYVASETKEGVRDIVGAIREGVVGEEGNGVCCPSCKQSNDHFAKFCDACGEPMSFEKDCPDCETSNDHEAKFCDGCGSAF